MGPRPFSRGNSHWSYASGRSTSWASMGPRPFSRGNENPGTQGGQTSRRFNGAATFQSRKRHRIGRRPDQTSRFNGAATFQSRKRGGIPGAAKARSSFNGAATFQSRKRGWVLSQAAPVVVLQWGRDLSVAETRAGVRRGLGPGALQWGRDLSVAETDLRSARAAWKAKLQWGRDLSVAETWQMWLTWAFSLLRASMGPRPFSRGNMGARG